MILNEQIFNEIGTVPVFDEVKIALWPDGSPAPGPINQSVRHKNTIREYVLQKVLTKDSISQRNSVWAEFGVENGNSAKYILKHLPKNGTLHLFDSCQGLPEAWNGKAAGHRKAVQMPSFDDPRVKFHIGWFKDTLPCTDILSFVHIDCDLYSSTKEVLEGIQVAKGTIILFDELFGYPDWENNEYKALQEYDRPFRYIARDDHSRAAIEILE
jgi:hypothetical protein